MGVFRQVDSGWWSIRHFMETVAIRVSVDKVAIRDLGEPGKEHVSLAGWNLGVTSSGSFQSPGATS